MIDPIRAMEKADALRIASPVLQWVIKQRSRRINPALSLYMMHHCPHGKRRAMLMRILIGRLREKERQARREAIKAAYPGVTTDEQADTLYNMWSNRK